MLLIDKREPPQLIALLQEKTPCTIRYLNSGDYVSGNIGVERKTVRDFYLSLQSGRLLRQLTLLRLSYDKTYLLIEGAQNMKQYAKLKGFFGLLHHITLSGTPILFTDSKEQTARVLAKLSWSTKNIPFLKALKLPTSVHYDQQRILTSFPHIGLSRSATLLSQHKTLRKLFSLSYAALKKSGIGKQAAKKMATLLDRPFTRSTVKKIA